jgi:hypothetical protein
MRWPDTTAVATLPAANTSSAVTSTVRRDQLPVRAASSGESTAYAMENTLTNWPAAATLTDRSG